VTFQRKKGLILLDQIRTLDKTRLVKKMGMTTSKTLSGTLDVLQDVFAL
jgi:mRNA interferase MazF